MKTYTILCLVLVGILLSAVVFAVPADRFKGASYDGYDQKSYMQANTDYDLIFARFKGSSYDGYDPGSVTNLAVYIRPQGSVFRFR